MFLKKFLCLLITCNFQLNRLVQCKAWPDQFNRFNYTNQNNENIGWSNPYQDYNQDPATTSQRPLYPNLYSRNNPYPYDDRQKQVKPFDVQPLLNQNQSNIGDNQRNDYLNNFNYPYDNTRTTTTYPPFDGSTRRNTFPTRRQFYTIPTYGSLNNTAPNGRNNQTSGNNYQNQHNNNQTNPYRPFLYPQFNDGNNRNGPFPNVANNHQNGQFPSTANNNQNRPLPNAVNSHQNGPYPNAGNNYQHQNRYNNTAPQNPTFQNSQFYNGNDRNQPFRNDGNNYSNQNRYNNNPTYQNRPFSSPQFNDERNQHQSNYQPNNQNAMNVNSILTNQNSYSPSAPPAPQNPVHQQPDFDPSGVALAPFPDEHSDPSKYGARKHFNYDNLYHRYPSKPNVDSRFSSSETNVKKVPLASGVQIALEPFGDGARVPLAPF